MLDPMVVVATLTLGVGFGAAGVLARKIENFLWHCNMSI